MLLFSSLNSIILRHNYPQDVLVNGASHKAGTPIGWTPQAVRDRQMEAQSTEGNPVIIAWDEAALLPIHEALAAIAPEPAEED